MSQAPSSDGACLCHAPCEVLIGNPLDRIWETLRAVLEALIRPQSRAHGCQQWNELMREIISEKSPHGIYAILHRQQIGDEQDRMFCEHICAWIVPGNLVWRFERLWRFWNRQLACLQQGLRFDPLPAPELNLFRFTNLEMAKSIVPKLRLK